MIYIAALAGYVVVYGLARGALEGRFPSLRPISYILLVSVGFSLLLASRNVGLAYDDANYIKYGIYADRYLGSTLDGGWVFFVLDDPLYEVLNYALVQVAPSEYYVPLLIFVSFCLLSLGVYKLSGRPLLTILVFLLFVPIANNWYLHLRQGLALSVFLFGLSSNSRVRYVLMSMSPLIHTSMFVVIGSFVGDKLAAKVIPSRWVRLIMFVGVAVTFAWVLEDLLSIMGYMSNRRQYEDAGQMASVKTYLAYVVLWFGVVKSRAGSLLSGERDQLLIQQFAYGIALYIAMGYTVPYAARVFENYIVFGFLGILSSRFYRSYSYYLLVSVIVAMVVYMLPWHPFVLFDYRPFGFELRDVLRLQ